MTALEIEANWPMFEWRGAYYPLEYSKIEYLLSLEKFQVKEGDIFLSSFMRSGSMWTQAVIWSILNYGKPLPERLQIEFPHIDLIDSTFLKHFSTPRTFKTHLSTRSVPKSSSAKYICIVRNIYDCCLSLYDYNRKNYKEMGAEKYVSLDRHVEYFIQGLMPMGDYFEVCQSWFDLKDQSNVLFLTYEEQRKNIKDGILKIAKFLGNEYYEELILSSDIMEQIICNTELNSMKESKSYRFPVISFSDDLVKQTKGNHVEDVSLNDDNSIVPKDLIFKGEVGRALTGLTEKHRELLYNALETKIKSKELRDILGKL